MGDSSESSETSGYSSESNVPLYVPKEVHCDQLLNVPYLTLNDEGGSIPWIMNHIDHFVSHSRGNDSVTDLHLYPQDFYGHDDVVWDKLGQAVGNLQALERLCICTPEYHDDVDEAVPIPNWEILALVLSHLRQRITLVAKSYDAEDEDYNISAWSAEAIRSFARAIHGHPTITRFEGGEDFPYASLDAFYSALASLPALESVLLSSGIGTTKYSRNKTRG
jgi:hypothetical protein